MLAYDARTEARHGYGDRVGLLWDETARTLRRLDALAAQPVEELGDAVVDELLRLQYALHLAGERLVGIRPPAAIAQAHEELADALAGARDATAEIAEVAATAGWETAAPLVWEWRGALFRVRLARMLLAPQRPPAEPEIVPEPQTRAAAAAFALTLVGGGAFVSGAVIAAWPLWAAGMVAVVAGLLAYRP